MQKQLRKVSEKYEKEREVHDTDNKNWLEKYDSTVYDFEKQISEVKQTAEEKVLQCEERTKREIEESGKVK